MKLKRTMGATLFLLVLLAFAGIMLWMMALDTGPAQQPIAIYIGVVVYGENTDRWRSLDQGIGQACRELGLEKPSVVVARSGEAAKQLELLQRELSHGVQGLLIAPVTSDAVEGFLPSIPSSVPVVLLEAGAQEWTSVGVDDAQLGRELAQAVAQKPGRVAVVDEGVDRRCVALRHQAFCDEMAALGREVLVLDWGGHPESTRAFLTTTLEAPQFDILVLLDNTALEAAVEVVGAVGAQVELCGVGASDKILSALDRGLVSIVAYPNEYAAGYLGMLRLAHQLKVTKAAPPQQAQFIIVHREELYQPAIEHLLFPITQ